MDNEHPVNAGRLWRCLVMTVAAVLLLAVTAVTVQAECITAAQWKENVTARSVGVMTSVQTDVEGAEARAMVARMNARPPVTNLQADHIVVMSARHIQSGMPMSYVLVAFFNAGCLVASGKASPDEVDLLTASPGEPV